jgi:F-type H+-transporting ATPase subunit b
MESSVILSRLAPFVITFFPAAVFASEDGGSPLGGFLWRIFVFAVFAVILYKLLAKRIRNGLADSAENIGKTIQDAENACAAAEKELAEYSVKIAGMTKELEDMKDAARRTAEKEAENILAEAELAAAKYKKQIETVAEAELIKAISNLRSEMALLAAEQAEATLAARKDSAEREGYISSAVKKIGA